MALSTMAIIEAEKWKIGGRKLRLRERQREGEREKSDDLPGPLDSLSCDKWDVCKDQQKGNLQNDVIAQGDHVLGYESRDHPRGDADDN